jgi:two-component system, response regulator / RNA-binding antiterminator
MPKRDSLPPRGGRPPHDVSLAVPLHAPSTARLTRVLLIDDDIDRAARLRTSLRQLGYEVIADCADSLDLYEAVQRLEPDVVIIDTDSPSRDALEHIALVAQHAPKPIVMFATDGSSEVIRRAVRAGVSAYVVDGLSAERLQPILHVAVERFTADQELRAELVETKVALSERKRVERAKGLIMKREGVDEEQAFRLLRKFAMDQGIRMGEASQRMIDILKALA